MHKAKLIGVAVALVIVIILILQNTASVDTRILFATVTMPRALLLAITALLGVLAGLLLGLSRRKPPKDPLD